MGEDNVFIDWENLEQMLKKIFFVLVGLCVPLGFFMEHDPVHFWWHNIPSLDVIVGGVGALLLLGVMKVRCLLRLEKGGLL